MSIEVVTRLVAGLLLLLSNAFFVATEFSLTRLRQFTRDELDLSKRGLKLAWEMTETLEIYLTGCQVGITFSSILLGIVAEPAVTELFQLLLGGIQLGSTSTHALSITVSVVLINMAHTVWGEQTPTYLGIERARQVARYFAPPLYYWTKLTYPFIWFGDKVTKATLGLLGIRMSRSWLDEESETPSKGDLRSEIGRLLKSNGMSSDRRDEVIKAVEIEDIPVRKIMVPSEDIVTLTTKKNFRENLEVIKNHMHARYPLIESSLDQFKGILYTPQIMANVEELMSGKRRLDDFDWPRMTISQDLPVSELIDQFQEQHHELALVTKAGSIVGLVTLTDAIETIVGSAEDPLDLI